MTLNNQAGASFRADLNNAMQALVGNSSGASAPATMFAFQFWADTANDILKMRNSANTAWISLLTMSTGVPLQAPAGATTMEFRLTLTSSTPVTTADVTGATTVYCTPYSGNGISLWNGSAWVRYTSSEFSLGLGTLTASLPYDVFCYQNSGTPTLEFLAWSSATTRATSLAYQNGVLVKNGDPTRRYFGTFYTTSTTQTEDSQANRYLWNMYNRALRSMRRIEPTASWGAYNTGPGIRQANNSTANQLNFVVGVAGDVVPVHLGVTVTGNNADAQVGIALDSITTPTRQVSVGVGAVANYAELSLNEHYIPAVGRHYIAWLEQYASTTPTYWGTKTIPNTPAASSGLTGTINA
jgi:hypothetical protein